MDVTLRTDRQIATLLDFVNTRVGLTNTLIAFTADHGVSPIPEQAKELGLGGERLSLTDFFATINKAIMLATIHRESRRILCFDYLLKSTQAGASREHFINGNIYFNYDALRRDGVSVEEFSHVVIAGALTFRGVARASFSNSTNARRDFDH